ncbi:transposase [Rhizobium leguminosarum]|uniref:DDE-type integrase/transposase/recombinase n=1 Tax=Rhizobium leguminosarum TaxID=384 RepID=UPI00102F5E26|nr:DDE-type integrase/transposase/recombinase [Rhizobium leguminosarum]TBF36973.1 transposase [Rhizobium leguminosarum]
MLPPIDASPGQKFAIEHQGERFKATFVKSKTNGQLVFDRNDRKERWYVDRTKYIFMRIHSKAVLLEPGNEETEKFVVEPGAFEPIIPSDSPKVRARKKRYLKATIRLYYVECIDEYEIPRSNEPIKAFIEKHAETHKKLFGEDEEFKAPGGTSLIRYCREYGEKHYRPFQYFLSNSGGDHKSGLWANCIKVLKWTIVEWYWGPFAPSDRVVKAWFKGEVATERKRRLALALGDEAGDEMRRLMSDVPPIDEPGNKITLGTPQVDLKDLSENDEKKADFAEPCLSTLQNWLDAAATLQNIARREGRTIANRQIEGVHHNAVVTHRPLQCVVMDHTQIDLHVVVYDEKGNIKEETYRPWLIIVMDVHTRMVLAANLSVGSPSLQTLYAGLKQTLKPKYFLNHLNLGDAYAWSLDCFGLFKRMLVDNDLANTGRSLRSSAAAIGLRVSFAPVKTPPYKAVVERFFKTLNTNIWHEADGGVREKPGVSRVDPRKTARFTIKDAQEKLWNWIITVYHLDTHSELGIPPALMWKKSLQKYTRPLVKDMRDIDGAFGKSAKRMLTRAGIEYRNENFFDPELTTLLLDDLSGLGKGPRGTKELNSSRGVEVDFTEKETVGAISIFNPARGDYIDYPNRDPTKTGTYEDEVVERQKRNQETENFFARNELAINVANHFAGLKFNPTPVVDVAAASAALEATASDGRSSGHNLAARRRTEIVEQRPGARRGGRNATAKAAATRAVNRQRKEDTPPEICDEQRPAPVMKPPVIELRSSSAVASNPADASENLKTLHTANPFAMGGTKSDVDVSLE